MGEKQSKRERATLGGQAVVEGLGGGTVAIALGGELARGLVEVGISVAAAQVLGPALVFAVILPGISKLRDLWGRRGSDS